MAKKTGVTKQGRKVRNVAVPFGQVDERLNTSKFQRASLAEGKFGRPTRQGVRHTLTREQYNWFVA